MMLPAVMTQHGALLMRAWLWAPVSALTAASVDSVSFPLVSHASLVAFQEFLQYVLNKYFRRNQAALAAAIGIDVRSLRRTIHPEEGKHTFSLEHCLTLAKALHPRVNASYVLRKADKAALAQLIEELYGRAKLSADEEALLAAWNALDLSEQAFVFGYVKQTVQVAQRARANADIPGPPREESPRAPSAKPAKSRRRKR